MSAAGRKKKLERASKRAKREMLTPHEKMTSHGKAKWNRGAARLMLALQGRRIPD